MTDNLALRFTKRPSTTGLLVGDEFAAQTEDVPVIHDGQALVRTLFLSIDAASRTWLNEGRSYIPPVELGAVMRAIGVGQVVESRRDDLAVGDLVVGLPGWQEYAVADDDVDTLPYSKLPEPLVAPLPVYLGALGTSGVAAYVGLTTYGKVAAGETVVVTAAAGAVGSVAGQVASARGARVVGVAGTTEKCDWLTGELGFDAAVNYRDAHWSQLMDAATPNGIDVQYENVGGEVFNHCLARINLNARIVLCGLSSQYNDQAGSGVPLSLWQVLAQRATISGFIVFDHADKTAEAIEYLSGLVRAGKLKHRTHVVEGLENAPAALNSLFRGDNTGKLVIHVADPE
jgi:NADPH-dependent curcumin reductase CurA